MRPDDIGAPGDHHPHGVVAIWNELTPYRLHVLRRIHAELDAVRLINVFTHSVARNSMPWELSVPPGLLIEHFEGCKIPSTSSFAHKSWRELAARVLGVIDRERPRMVIMHGHRDLVRMQLIRQLGRRGIPMLHASDANIFEETCSLSPKGIARSLMLRGVLRRMSGYLPMGAAGRAFYHRYGLPDRPMFPFPYEPDYDFIQSAQGEEVAAASDRLGLEMGRRRFLYSGRLIDIKRVDVLIDAFASLAGERPAWDLVIAGSGPLEAALRSRAGNLLGDRIRFIGFQQMDTLRSVYRACDVLVHPSEREPWALVINEAVAAGMAVIATDVTGAAIELVREGVNGLLVRPGSAGILANAMRRASDPSNLDSFKAAAPRVLQDWRAGNDPVLGFWRAVQHFCQPPREAGPGQAG